MSKGPIRRSQLVSPFGVGALSVLVDGTSVITAGLDHWYKAPDLEISDFIENDWRLQRRLRVNEFRLPPDFRLDSSNGARNTRLTVPVLRFPLWHFCLYCKRLEKATLTQKDWVLCPDDAHAERKNGPRMAQVPFVSMCSDGHLDDFPFRKWVHKSEQPTCKGVLRLKSTGAGGLEGQTVSCDSCKKKRSLLGITNGGVDAEGTEYSTLSRNLTDSPDPYLCTGAMPWLAIDESPCEQVMRGALRGAGNVYFPKVESSIYLPKTEGRVSQLVHQLLTKPTISPLLKILAVTTPDISVEALRSHLPLEEFETITDDELMAGYLDLVGKPSEETEETSDVPELGADDEWRFPEYKVIRETPQDNFLSGSDPGLSNTLTTHLQRVRSVDVLRETRVLRGFTRLQDGRQSLTEGKKLLRRTPLPLSHDWLPTYVVKGEGIYLELDSGRLTAWENRGDVRARADRLARLSRRTLSSRGLTGLSPRFILLHTLSHLLINRMVFTSGYSSASLRERLYTSEKDGQEMASVLIYTAAGDSEGTMGGLVRMARPDRLESVLTDALEAARWCSTDPVCMTAGEGGQGPNSANMAACHGCALLPETSCEHYNSLLDRGLVIGTFDDPTLGFFHDMTA